MNLMDCVLLYSYLDDEVDGNKQDQDDADKVNIFLFYLGLGIISLLR